MKNNNKIFQANADLSSLLDRVKDCLVKKAPLRQKDIAEISSKIDEIKHSLRIVGKPESDRPGLFDAYFDKTCLPSHALKTLKEAYQTLGGDDVLNGNLVPTYHPLVQTYMQHLYFLINELIE